jgi:hypothetical protein
MVHNTQNYWVFGLCPNSDVVKTRNHDISETGLFRPQVRRGKGTQRHLAGYETLDKIFNNCM